MIAEGFVGRTVDHLITEVVTGGANHERIIVFIGRLFALDIGLGDIDTQANGFGLEVLVIAGGPVGTPAGLFAIQNR